MAGICRVLKIFAAKYAFLGGCNHRIPMSFSTAASRLIFGFLANLANLANIASQIVKRNPVRFAGGKFASPV
jgi:hypothetical protein